MSSTLKSRNGKVGFTDLMIFRNRWWQHLLFWAISLFVLLNIFKGTGSPEKIDVIYTLIFSVPIVCLVYLNLYLFVPRFLRREKYLVYAFFICLLIAVGALFLYLLFDSLIDLLLPNYYFIAYYNVPILMLYTSIFLILTTLLKLSRSWFMLLRVERLTTSFQLKSLQSQINPHFLLNSLQSIYALSIEKSEQTPRVILQLADILKYTLYETEQPWVNLEKEMEMVKDYVEIHQHRIDPAHAEIKLEIEGDPQGCKIAPMLLIPFIENSFKHGLQGSAHGAYVNIRMEVESCKFLFQIENNLGQADSIQNKEKKGIGIENTRQRLELLYPGRHSLSIGKRNKSFVVKLDLDLNE